MDAEKVGKAIKTLRGRAGYTQLELADRLGVTDKAVSKWERGLSVPDVSIVTRLSILLNVDVDNLLEGNITFLSGNWQGLLILEEGELSVAGSEVFEKPLVCVFLCYFLLAGIGDIYISCSERDEAYIRERFGDGRSYGISLRFLPAESRTPPTPGNTMVVCRNPFVYGPNLTKYFQRAMSRSNGITVMTAIKKPGTNESPILYDNHRAARLGEKEDKSGRQQTAVPILFYPKRFFERLERIDEIGSLDPLFAEPMGNGMIAYRVTDPDALHDTDAFLRFLYMRTGLLAYDLKTVAQNRGFFLHD